MWASECEKCLPAHHFLSRASASAIRNVFHSCPFVPFMLCINVLWLSIPFLVSSYVIYCFPCFYLIFRTLFIDSLYTFFALDLFFLSLGDIRLIINDYENSKIWQQKMIYTLDVIILGLLIMEINAIMSLYGFLKVDIRAAPR